MILPGVHLPRSSQQRSPQSRCRPADTYIRRVYVERVAEVRRAVQGARSPSRRKIYFYRFYNVAGTWVDM